MSKPFKGDGIIRRQYDRPVLIPHRDYNAYNVNYPVVLTRARDPFVWTKDPMIKTARRNVGSPSETLDRIHRQYIRQYISDYTKLQDFGLMSNVRLVVGGKRLT